jgi:hypothetical protein
VSDKIQSLYNRRVFKQQKGIAEICNAVEVSDTTMLNCIPTACPQKQKSCHISATAFLKNEKENY